MGLAGQQGIEGPPGKYDPNLDESPYGSEGRQGPLG